MSVGESLEGAMRSKQTEFLVGAATVWVLLTAPTTWAFVDVALSGNLSTAPRWSSTEAFGRGLANGTIDVAINGGFAADIALAVTGGALPQDVAEIESAVRAAFAAWESPVLRFDVTFGAAALRGPAVGLELDVFQVHSSDPEFAASGASFGVTYMLWNFSPTRVLTNGATLPGLEIYGADILIAVDRLAAVAPAFNRDEQVKLFQRLMMHEIGHALGLHHPHDGPSINFDTDTVPNNAILVDPFDPLPALILSPNRDTLAVMNQIPGGGGLFYTTLRNDDRGGRDVLYPALAGTQDVCQPHPSVTCRTARKAKLKIRDHADDDKDKLQWKWTKGDATTAVAFGSPVPPRYSLCLYKGELPVLFGEIALPPGTAWQSAGDKGFKYDDATRLPHGARIAQLKAGAQDKAKVVVKAAGPDMPDGLLPVGASLPVVAQLVRADTMGCWISEYDELGIRLDEGGKFNAKQQ
jgi:hypothetical protein